MVSTAAETYFKERAETMRRLEVLNNTLAQNTKYIVPSNSSLVNVLGLDSAVQAAADAVAPKSPRNSYELDRRLDWPRVDIRRKAQKRNRRRILGHGVLVWI